jgi:DNA-binding HxlR family transcriptional regulator
MAKTNTYQHFCPVARSLEVVGEKWSLLIVRDLLRGPRRFTDLAASLKSITPKWLTLRLRDLESAGVVSRQSEQGRREVWYSLTPVGEDLRYVVAALNEWGIRHELRPPIAGESVSARAMIVSSAGFLISTRTRFDSPRTWRFVFSTGEEFQLVFDGSRWSISSESADSPDVTVTANPSDWASFLAAADHSRSERLSTLEVRGNEGAVREFLDAFKVGVPA